ncbi:MAG TPA: ComF family protein [Armatimonadota bacterium]|nr:ComF family protein [Armatimonadota bacterium]
MSQLKRRIRRSGSQALGGSGLNQKAMTGSKGLFEMNGSFARQLVDTIFPERCFGCRRLSGTIWCIECRGELERVEDPVCPRCGDPLETETCNRCRWQPPPYDSLTCGYVYNASLRGIILALKYRGYRRLAAPMGDLIRPLLIPVIHAGVELIIPMPSDPLRRWRRGFNPAELIAQAAVEPLGIALAPGILRRTWGGRPQVGLNPERRRINSEGRFCVPQPALVTGRNAVVIDDVFTTGSTCAAAARTLKAAGAAAVHALALARD